jgi:hypothetical protein
MEDHHRHTGVTIPKQLRGFFRYDRKLNTILFRAASGALSEVLGFTERELTAIFTVQTKEHLCPLRERLRQGREFLNRECLRSHVR